MNRRTWLLASRAAFAALALGAFALASRVGSPPGRAVPSPRPDSVVGADAGASAAAAPSMAAGEAYEVALRLVEAASEARFDEAKHPGAQHALDVYTRKASPAFTFLAPGASRSVATIALRTSRAETKKETKKETKAATTHPSPKTPLKSDKASDKEVSFDERDALVSRGSSTIRFKVVVPAGAKLSFAEGTLAQTKVPTVFAVSVLDQNGSVHSLHEHALLPEAARKWTDQSVDLSELAGQTVELRLATSTAQAETVSLWGNPVILAKTTPRVPYNVLWIVVDSLRPDVLPSFHDAADDAAKRRAKLPPEAALLPKVPGLTPAIDDLASRGVRFTNAYSAASSTRPGTLAMLAGARASELGVDPAARFYASDPPLLPLMLRRRGVVTCAFVNNPFIGGTAPLGIDMGFERVVDHRYRTRDTAEITEDATTWLRDNADTRFLMFVHYNSPRAPYDPPKALVEKIPPPPKGPKAPAARLYMAEAAKDDEAIGAIVRTLDETGLRDRTIVVLTADHGATLSAAHKAADDNYEETTRVPMLIVAPGLLTAGAEVKARSRTIDLVPTLTSLLGIEGHPRTSGKSLVGLANGGTEPDERVVVTEGRGSRAIMHGRYRFVLGDGAAQAASLFDLVSDPGERVDIKVQRPDVVAEMKARLEAALANVPVAGSAAAIAAPSSGESPVIRVRLVGAGQARRVSGAIVIGDAKRKAKTFAVVPIEIGHEALKVEGTRVELALTTTPSAAVGVDIVVDPPGVPVTWELFVDEQPLEETSVFGGPYGLLAPTLRGGVETDEARAEAHAAALPPIDPRRDAGLFVVRATGRP